MAILIHPNGKITHHQAPEGGFDLEAAYGLLNTNSVKCKSLRTLIAVFPEVPKPDERNILAEVILSPHMGINPHHGLTGIVMLTGEKGIE
jgi:hypothetical protein